ncbi:MAG: hypothetical protein ACPGU7_02950 [Gammaproteobacteria bacterium]
MSVLRALPFFLIILGLYNALMLAGDVPQTLATELTSVSLISGAVWTLTVSDLFISIGVITLYIEIFKSTRTSMASVVDHTLSTLVFVGFIVEFLVVPACGTSTFLILGLMSLLDVIAGFTVTIVAARRDFGFNHGDM